MCGEQRQAHVEHQRPHARVIKRRIVRALALSVRVRAKAETRP
jgi:hypothetical protein